MRRTRLTTAHIAGHDYTYYFDGTGGCGVATAAGSNTNRTSMVDNSTTTSYCYDHADRITSSTDTAVGTIGYDGQGNSTAIFGETHGYDAANRHLTTVKGATTVAYTRDALDRIVERKVNGTVAARYSSSAGGDTPDLTLDGANNVIEQTLVLPGGAMYTNRPGTGGSWTEVDPVGDCTSTAANGEIDISVPTGTTHDLFDGLETPCQMAAEHDGDLDWTVHFTSDPRDIYQIQGIVVATTSPGDYGRFDLVAGDLGNGQGVNAFVAASTDGQLNWADIKGNTKLIGLWDPASEWWIHVTRTGDQWTYSVSQDGTTYTQYANFSWAVTVTTVGVYAGNAGSNPAFDMHAEMISGGPTGGSQVWSYPNTHGDYVATTDGAGAKQGATATYDPYGNLASGAVPDNSTGSMDYGWLGQHQRPLEQRAGLEPMIEMGARQYSSRLGRFIEQDPIEGGSANDYDYVNGDPVNRSDLTGRCPECGMLALIGAISNSSVNDYLRAIATIRVIQTRSAMMAEEARRTHPSSQQVRKDGTVPHPAMIGNSDTASPLPTNDMINGSVGYAGPQIDGIGVGPPWWIEDCGEGAAFALATTPGDEAAGPVGVLVTGGVGCVGNLVWQ